jgi:hypothetical protein
MDKSAAIRLLPRTIVVFRGRRHQVVSAKSGAQSEAPFFRLRALDDGAMTGLVSHRVIEREPEEPDKADETTQD